MSLSKEECPLVSVVIPTYNSEKTIGICLESIKNQTYKNIEIIVVDKFSDDNTVKIAKKYTDKVFVINAKERSEQLNFGVKMAKGKYIYRVDSDFVLEPTVIEEAVKKCEEEGYDAVCIHNTSDPTISFWAKVRKLERDCYEDDKLNVAARFIRKDAFENVGGFDENLVAAEDYDLHNRLLRAGYKIGRIKSKEIHIGEPKSLWEIIKKHYYYGKTLPKFVEKNKGRGIKQLSPIRPAYLKHWKKFVKHPVLTLGFIIYQISRYGAAGIGYIVGKMKFIFFNRANNVD
ncbi:glycosyl transferase family protein [Methanocaldococcus villosus KIN24-T80]|uniref:Glycosyl transferase family protein n=1 Tax=Methanocaldococcus villosus KIN24-T80 TaxID=1069083 RepID=N6UV38_9EURY|nr:glycosyltransferase [Methanocaldococcus villosus]ENN96229.1 glycosyl transferase family protein [Methanocaldococcus villosus KIN24-T80]